jgi:RNA polymerase sigma-70 factor (ECF subfamily)
MVGLGRALLGNRDLAEEAAQETFAIACRRLRTLRRPERFAWWLRGICRRVARGMLRPRGERMVREPPGVPKDAIDAERDEVVRRAVDRLPPSAREVVLLHYFVGMTHKDIASMLGISPQAVHGRLVRARRKIAGHLARAGLGSEP